MIVAVQAPAALAVYIQLELCGLGLVVRLFYPDSLPCEVLSGCSLLSFDSIL